DEGLAYLESALADGRTGLVLARVDWAKFLGQFAAAPALFERVARDAAPAAAEAGIVSQLRTAPAGERRRLLIGHVQAVAGRRPRAAGRRRHRSHAWLLRSRDGFVVVDDASQPPSGNAGLPAQSDRLVPISNARASRGSSGGGARHRRARAQRRGGCGRESD